MDGELEEARQADCQWHAEVGFRGGGVCLLAYLLTCLLRCFRALSSTSSTQARLAKLTTTTTRKTWREFTVHMVN